MKVLRIDLQTDDVSVYDSKEQLRKGLIDLHMDDIISFYFSFLILLTHYPTFITRFTHWI